MLAPDQILISNLALHTRVGVTDTEQSQPQRLTVSLVLTPTHGFDRLDDRIEHTINYSSVCKAVRELAASAPPRRLIETLAGDIAALVLARFEYCAAVEVELRKYILPDTDYVAVRLSRRRTLQP